MYDRLCKYLTKNILLFDKEFRFRECHSREQALLKLITPNFETRKKQFFNELQTNICFAMFFKETNKDYV